MKTPALLLAALAACAFVQPSSAQEPTVRARRTFTLPKPATPLPKSEPTIDEGSRTGGVIGRVTRTDNVFQLINPFAPARYGSGEKMTDGNKSQGTQTSGEEEKPKVIKLFSYEF